MELVKYPLSTKEWRAYYLGIALTSRYIDLALQVLLDEGKISFSDFFAYIDLKKATDQELNEKLMPAYLADRRFLCGAVDVDFLKKSGVWQYYAQKYMFHYEAILRYGEEEATIEWIYQNLLIDLGESSDDEFRLLRG